MVDPIDGPSLPRIIGTCRPSSVGRDDFQAELNRLRGPEPGSPEEGHAIAQAVQVHMPSIYKHLRILSLRIEQREDDGGTTAVQEVGASPSSGMERGQSRDGQAWQGSGPGNSGKKTFGELVDERRLRQELKDLGEDFVRGVLDSNVEPDIVAMLERSGSVEAADSLANAIRLAMAEHGATRTAVCNLR